MKALTGIGTGMHLDSSYVRFGRKSTTGPSTHLLADRVVEVRRFLRTNMTIGEIAESLSVSVSTLRSFIKRRQLCSNLAARRDFISLQRSLAKLDKEPA